MTIWPSTGCASHLPTGAPSSPAPKTDSRRRARRRRRAFQPQPRPLRWDLVQGGLPDEFLYRVEGISRTPPSPTDVQVNGLVEAIALDRDRLLTLERQWLPGVGIEIKLYAVNLAGAPNVARIDPPASLALSPAAKTLVLDFADLGLPLDNFEGMAFGPPLADGRRPLVLVSDDNFNPDLQKTYVLAFAAGFEPLSIAALQGPDHRSPLAGRWVAGIEGVVTATEDSARAKGFWMESLAPDADPATSEGIYVAWEGAFTLHRGDRVRVGGRVEEVGAPASACPSRPCGSLPSSRCRLTDPPLPAPVKLFTDRKVPAQIDDDGLTRFEPASDAIDFWESLEGMRAEIPAGTVVGPTSSRGDLVLRPDGAARPAHRAGGVLLPEAGPSLDRVLAGRRIAGEMPRADVGARVRGPSRASSTTPTRTTGFWPLAPLAVERGRPRLRRAATLRGDRRHLTIASFNVENLSVAGPAERFARIGEADRPQGRRSRRRHARGGPGRQRPGRQGRRRRDVDEGRSTRLVAGIAAAGGPRYEAVWIDPVEGREGGQPGGNIRVALLLNPARVTLVKRAGRPARRDGARGPRKEAPPHAQPRARRPRSSTAFTLTEGRGSAGPLAVELRFRREDPFSSSRITWSSKSDDDRAFGAPQPPRTPTTSRRLAQARESAPSSTASSRPTRRPGWSSSAT